jgi:hypothetical protein
MLSVTFHFMQTKLATKLEQGSPHTSTVRITAVFEDVCEDPIVRENENILEKFFPKKKKISKNFSEKLNFFLLPLCSTFSLRRSLEQRPTARAWFQTLQKIGGVPHISKENLDCPSFVMCPLLELLLPRAFFLFFCHQHYKSDKQVCVINP